MPEVTQDELVDFQAKHFSAEGVHGFALEFFQPDTQGSLGGIAAEDDYYDDEYDDELGYYEDGTKRTLTDDQIAMFRHSELEAVRRELDKRRETASYRAHDQTGADEGRIGHVSEATDKDTPDSSHETPQQHSTNALTKSKKKKSRKGAKGQTQEPKPDLRKRTWDVVDQGLDSLEYD